MTGPAPTLEDWVATTFPDVAHLSLLGQGGQKLVFKGTHRAHGSVVLKLLRPPVNHESARREILAVQTIVSPHVPLIIDHGVVGSQWGDVYWIIEEEVNGATLRDVISSSTLAPREVLSLARGIIQPLVAAESAHIVHRDVKPDNIMRSNDGRYWLLDFGLARHLTLSSLTATALPFGKLTPGYAPAEQFRNHKQFIDARCDLFALGVTLYECATGVNPYRHGAADTLEIFRRIEKAPFPRISIGLVASKDFEDLIACLTQRRREHRPRTALEAKEWIDDICAQEGF